ncbi:MAG: peptidoglycan-binding protein [Acidobacteriota bacterium]
MPAEPDIQLPDFRLPDFEALPDIHSRVDDMTVLVDRADRDGVLPALPGHSGEVQKEQLLASRIVTIRTRLFLLGYLRRDNKRRRLDGRLERAIAEFQTEAGLTVDRWVGAESWTALQELVDFETPLDVARWTRPEVQPVLFRAARLRLFVLGCFGSRRLRGIEKLEPGLELFTELLWRLRFTENRLPSRLEPETLAALFDQDGLVASLASPTLKFPVRSLAGSQESDVSTAEELARRFLVSVARVELWLLGYDLPLNGRGAFKVPRRFPYQRGRFQFFYALEQFWRSRGRSIAEARRLSKTLRLSFFSELEAIGREAERADGEQSDAIYREISELSPRSQRSVWSHVQSVGSRIWDGVKRVWRWFKTVIGRGRRIIHKVFEWTKNLARFAYRYALQSFAVVKLAAQQTVKSVSFLLKDIVPGSDVNHVIMRREPGLDYMLVVNPGRDPATILDVTGNFAHMAAVFSTSVQVLTRLVSFLIRVVKTFTWPTGWFGFVMALVRLFRFIRTLVNFQGDDLELLATA